MTIRKRDRGKRRRKSRSRRTSPVKRKIKKIVEDVSLPIERERGKMPSQEQVERRPDFLKEGIGAWFMLQHDEFIAENPDHWSIPTERFISGLAVGFVKALKSPFIDT